MRKKEKTAHTHAVYRHVRSCITTVPWAVVYADVLDAAANTHTHKQNWIKKRVMLCVETTKRLI